MKRHHGSEWVTGGIYWDTSTWEFIPIPKEGGTLPGDRGKGFIKAPMPLVMVAGPRSVASATPTRPS